MFTVYVLYSDTSKKHYTGYTSNLTERMKSHNLLGKGWTAKYRPWRIIYTKELKEKKQAMEYEKWLKSGTGRKFVKELAH